MSASQPSGGIKPDKFQHVEESLANIREALL